MASSKHLAVLGLLVCAVGALPQAPSSTPTPSSEVTASSVTSQVELQDRWLPLPSIPWPSVALPSLPLPSISIPSWPLPTWPSPPGWSSISPGSSVAPTAMPPGYTAWSTSTQHSTTTKSESIVSSKTSSSSSSVSPTSTPVLAPIAPPVNASNVFPGYYDVILHDNFSLEAHLSAIDAPVYQNITFNYTGFPGYGGFFNDDLLARIRSAPGVAGLEQSEAFEQDWDDMFLDVSTTADDELQKRDYGTQYYNSEWPLQYISGNTTSQIDAPDSRYNYTAVNGPGLGVDIYILDTGVRTTNQEFDGRAEFLASYYPGREGVLGDDSESGHGTAMASLAAGFRFGVAKYANIFSIKVAVQDSVNNVDKNAVKKALDRVLQNHGIRKGSSGFKGSIINMSFKAGTVEGAKSFPDGSGGTLAATLNRVYRAGIHSFASAGNTIIDCNTTWPAGIGAESNAKVNTIGGIGRDLKPGVSNPALSRGSAYGPAVRFWAPGYSNIPFTPGIVAAYNQNDTATHQGVGSSQACAITSGLGAYMLSLKPGTADEPTPPNILRSYLDLNTKDVVDVSKAPYRNTTNKLINNGFFSGGNPFSPFFDGSIPGNIVDDHVDATKVGNTLPFPPRQPTVTSTTSTPTPTSRTAPYSPTGSTGPNQVDKCHIHLWEYWACGDDKSNLAASLQLWDAAGQQMLAPTPPQSSPRHIDDGNPGSWTSKLEDPIVVTGEHQGDYVQFTVGGTSWQSRDNDKSAASWCNTGGWDPRGGPSSCAGGSPFDDPSQPPSQRQMDCYFPCPYNGGKSSDGSN